jgi:hypothetical protein
MLKLMLSDTDRPHMLHQLVQVGKKLSVDLLAPLQHHGMQGYRQALDVLVVVLS